MMLSQQNLMILSLVVVALMLMQPQNQMGVYARASNIAMVLSIAAPVMMRSYGVQPDMVQLGALALQVVQYLASKGMVPRFAMM